MRNHSKIILVMLLSLAIVAGCSSASAKSVVEVEVGKSVELVIIDNKNVKIELLDADTIGNQSGKKLFGLNFLIENKSDKKIAVSFVDESVDDSSDGFEMKFSSYPAINGYNRDEMLFSSIEDRLDDFPEFKNNIKGVLKVIDTRSEKELISHNLEINFK